MEAKKRNMNFSQRRKGHIGSYENVVLKMNEKDLLDEKKLMRKHLDNVKVKCCLLGMIKNH